MAALRRGEMKQVSSDFKRDFDFGQRVMLVTTPDQDMKENKDYILGSLGIAYRVRRLRSTTYGQLSIRHSRTNGAETELSKLLSGKTKAQLYIFEFIDQFVVCRVEDIVAFLRENKPEIVTNHDGITRACYIGIDEIPALIIKKQEGN